MYRSIKLSLITSANQSSYQFNEMIFRWSTISLLNVYRGSFSLFSFVCLWIKNQLNESFAAVLTVQTIVLIFHFHASEIHAKSPCFRCCSSVKWKQTSANFCCSNSFSWVFIHLHIIKIHIQSMWDGSGN